MNKFPEFQGPSPEWETFVKATPLPSGPLNPDAAALREATNSIRIQASNAEIEAEGLREKIQWTDHSIVTQDKCNIIARVYRPKGLSYETRRPLYLYFHGGGHLFGAIKSEDAACGRLSYGAGVIVVNVGYRHTPEFKHPTQVNDAWDAFLWLSEQILALGGDPTRVIVGGISAGAGLAASVALRQHRLEFSQEQGRPNLTIKGQLLCVPWLVHPQNHPLRDDPTSSYGQNIDAPILPKPLLEMFAELLDAKDIKDPSLNTGLVEGSQLVGLPKSSFLVAGRDMLRDEGLSYAEKLKANGVPTQVHVFRGLPHAFRRYYNLPSAKRWDELLVKSCEWILSDDETSSFDSS